MMRGLKSTKFIFYLILVNAAIAGGELILSQAKATLKLAEGLCNILYRATLAPYNEDVNRFLGEHAKKKPVWVKASRELFESWNYPKSTLYVSYGPKQCGKMKMKRWPFSKESLYFKASPKICEREALVLCYRPEY